MADLARTLYEQLMIEETYPEDCGGWWDFWKFYGRHAENPKDIPEMWQDWVDSYDPYPCQDEWEYL